MRFEKYFEPGTIKECIGLLEEYSGKAKILAGGTDVVTLSGRLGHSNKIVTLNTYSHMIKSREKLAANVMDQFYSSSDLQSNVDSRSNA